MSALASVTALFRGEEPQVTGTATAAAGAATLNAYSGVITSESLATAAGADYTLTLTNGFIKSTSRVIVGACGNGTNTTVPIFAHSVAVNANGGSVVILVRNGGGVALNGSIKINFLVI